MGNGRRAIAPCGHLGETVIGTYVQCLSCDNAAAPKAVIDRERTEPLWVPCCPGCKSYDIERFATDTEAAIWYLSSHMVPSGAVMPPSEGDWGCNTCAKVWELP